MKAQELVSWAEEAQRLRTAPVAVLVARYEELFGERPRARHRVFLWRRICWRLQANLQGGLSERAHSRALEIADDRDLRLTAPQPPKVAAVALPNSGRDRRLPLPGVVLKRRFRGQDIEVKVLVDGFEYQGRKFASLSAVAECVTGTRWNGFVFFGLQARKHAA
jgi:Protein of unknown function (DUF2924)